MVDRWMAGEEQDVWQWVERLMPEYELLRATNRKLVARVQELERMTGGALALTDDELIAALPHRVSRALRSAQRTSHDIIERAREREELVLQQAAEAAERVVAEARNRAGAAANEARGDADAIRRDAEAQARETVRRAQAQAEAILEEARTQAGASRRQASAEAIEQLERAEARAQDIAARAAGAEKRALRELSSREADLDQQFAHLEAARLEMLELVARLAEEALGPGSDQHARERVSRAAAAPAARTRVPAPAPARQAPAEAPSAAPVRPAASEAQRRAPERPARAETQPPASARRRTPSPRRPLDILLVSSANVFRSPTAQVLLQRRLDALGVPAVVRSAGLEGEGQIPDRAARQVLAPRGIDIGSHRSTLLTRRLLVGSDLVIGMAPSHAAAAVHMLPDALPYSFTLKELVRTGRRIGPRAQTETLPQWLTRAHAIRQNDNQDQFLGNSDFFEDPKGQPGEVYERLVVDLTRSVDQLVALLWPEETRRRSRALADDDVEPAGDLRRMPARSPADAGTGTRRARPA